jgi:hypothetical protein
MRVILATIAMLCVAAASAMAQGDPGAPVSVPRAFQGTWAGTTERATLDGELIDYPAERVEMEIYEAYGFIRYLRGESLHCLGRLEVLGQAAGEDGRVELLLREEPTLGDECATGGVIRFFDPRDRAGFVFYWNNGRIEAWARLERIKAP